MTSIINDIEKIMKLIGLVVEMPGKMKILRVKAQFLCNRMKTYISILAVIKKNTAMDRNVWICFCNQFKRVIKQAKSTFEKCVGGPTIILYMQKSNYSQDIEMCSQELDRLQNDYDFIKKIDAAYSGTTTLLEVTQTSPSELDERFEKCTNLINERGIGDLQSLSEVLYESHIISEKELNQLAPDKLEFFESIGSVISYSMDSMDSKASMDSMNSSFKANFAFSMESDSRNSSGSMDSSFKTNFENLMGGDLKMKRMKPFSEDELFENLKKIANSLNLEFNEETNGTLE